jgi:hypothetical protein
MHTERLNDKYLDMLLASSTLLYSETSANNFLL